jgi:hypothetical protein
MISFCGYNLSFDINSMDAIPSKINSINNTKLQNAIYDHFNITKDTNLLYTETIPTWTYKTKLNCNFENNISAGNVNFTLEQITSIKVKRRETGTFDWITIKEIEISTYEDLTFITQDYLSPTDTSFEYAIVPVLNGIEGDYVINSITSNFNGVFITDGTETYKLYNGVVYSNQTRSNESGILKPIGSQYPIVISNSSMDYVSGTIQGNLLGTNYDSTRKIDRINIAKQTKDFITFLRNGKSKILKDWNSNIYLININSDISNTTDLVNGISTVSFNWVEQGKYNVQIDLYRNGLSDNAY